MRVEDAVIRRTAKQEFFVSIMLAASKLSTCTRTQVGCVLVKNNVVISTGYNGNPHNVEHCYALGCIRELLDIPSGERHELCTGSHAEINAIIQAGLNNTSTADAELYTTHLPCAYCIKAIINARVRRVFYLNYYADDLSIIIAKLANLELIKLPL